MASVIFVALHANATIDASLQMQLGNPSGAIMDTNNHAHYLIQRTVESIDYSDNLGEPVWASWDLTTNDVGTNSRSSFTTDASLPSNFYHVTTTDYNGVGTNNFNRGHLCPSDDRTDTVADNKLVFLMSNIMPQSALNNQGVWGNFEAYCRSIAATNELLIICGGSGFGTNTIPSGKAYIPTNTWKVVVCVPLGSGTALSRITATDRVIAISIPNVTNGLSSAWQTYLTSPHRIELDTGFTFFTALPAKIASIFRTEVDGVITPPTLSLTLTNANALVISWLSPSTNFGLQQNSNLTTNWIDVTNAVNSDDGQNQVLLPMSETNNYFRLIESQ